ncbi:hypothetical protein [Absidia glauca]|uniref:Uncharacterized protein n=1 Tax=Absidia glauca TaxID=4829 RepID=A0A163KAA5_ABSGL|nr:hypothetical protein [Absidia glauca]
MLNSARYLQKPGTDCALEKLGLENVGNEEEGSCTSSPSARNPISVAILLILLREKEAMMQKTSVSHGKAKMDKMVRRGRLPCVRR